MKKKFAAFILCVLCLLSAVGCGQTKTDEQTPPTDQSAVTDDYLTTISGTYVELFPELSKSEYRNIWIDATAPLVGAENAEATTDLLLGMCMAEPYGPEAAENTRQIRTAWRSTAISWRHRQVRDGRSHDHRPGRAGTGGFLPHL